jgi:hypothetical protein
VLAAPHDLVDLIDPWQEPQPPHGQRRTGRSSLQRAYHLRQRCKGRPGDAGPATANLWPAAVLPWVIVAVMVGALALRLGWLAYAVVGGAMAATAYLRFRSRDVDYYRQPYYFNDVPGPPPPEGPPDQDWAQEYRDFYYTLTMTPIPHLIVSFEDATAGRDSGEDEAVATHLIARQALDLPEALLRSARLADPLLLGTYPLPPPQPLPKLLRPLLGWLRTLLPIDARTRARYSAVYDFFFAPQARFHAALVELDGREEIKGNETLPAQ